MAIKKGNTDRSKFNVGDRVLIQDVAPSKKWNSEGIIKDIRTSEDKTTHSYIVKSDNGNDILRSKRFLKLKPDVKERSVRFTSGS